MSEETKPNYGKEVNGWIVDDGNECLKFWGPEEQGYYFTIKQFAREVAEREQAARIEGIKEGWEAAEAMDRELVLLPNGMTGYVEGDRYADLETFLKARAEKKEKV